MFSLTASSSIALSSANRYGTSGGERMKPGVLRSAPHDRDEAVDVRAGIEPRRRLGAADAIGVGARRHLGALVPERHELAVAAAHQA